MSEAAPIAPTVLGGFVLQQKIGEGGFGTVYLAEQPSLKRLAVVKVMRGALVHRADAIRRFELEAQLASRLDHPCAAHIYAFGAEADGTLWIAMEHVKGTSLDALLAEGPLPLDRVVPMMARLCDAVATAHEQGIVHRDIKPANVIVAARGGRLSPKLLDFGIAKQLDGARDVPTVNATPEAIVGPGAAGEGTPPEVTLPSRGGATGVTQLGQLLGSPRYMAPEQWLDSRLIGPWTDQYALALLAYEALTGRRAFDGATTSELAEQHMTAVLPRSSLVSEAVYAVLARAVSKDPKARFADVGALAVALRDAAGLGPEADEPPPALRPELRAMWMNDAPQPIAEMIAALTAARSAGRVCERIAAVARTIAHWLAVLAIASRSRGGRLAANAAALAALRDLRRRMYTDEQWLDLAIALAGDFAVRPEAFPIPELIVWCTDGDAVGTLRPLLRGDLVDTDDAAATRRAAARVRELERALESLSWLLDYGLGRDVPGGVELWLGIRPVERVVDPWPSDSDPGVVVLDADGARAVKLSPLVLIAPPMPGEADEVFVFCGPSVGGDEGVYRAWPRGFELRDAAVWSWFAEHVLDAGPVEGARAQDDRPPYPGLAAFTGDDRASFVGREREVAEVVNRLRAQSIAAIVGPSGAGKSSFVAAGVLQALDGDHVTIRPGRRPLATLAAVASGGAPYRDALPADAGDPDLGARLVAAARGRAAQLTLFVDQAEELFTQCASEDERVAFAAALVALAGSGHARVILALRDDFLVRLDALDPWRGSLGRAIHILRTPARGDLERIVAEPARRRGFDFDDPALPAEMAAEVDGRPGALSLLAFAAASLWERRDRHFHRITRAAYADLGGVTGALVGHADGVLERMSPADRRIVRAVFRRLLTADGARVGHGRGELVAALADRERGAAVVERLLEARLLVSREDDDGEHVEVIHEALATTWTTLAEWRREDAAGLRRHAQLAAAARAWHDRGRPPGLLWRGEALDDLRRWLAATDAALLPVEDAFAGASIDAARRARRKRLVLVAGGFAALAGVIVVLAALNRDIADKRTTAEHLAAAGFEERARLALLDGNAAEALLYLAEATRRGVAGPAHDLLVHRATTSVEAFDGFAGRDPDRFLGMVLGERWIATSTGDVSTLWNRETGRPAVRVADGYACTLAGDAIITLNRSGELSSTDASGQVRWRAPSAHPGLAFAYPVLRSHTGAQVVASIDGNQVRLWALGDGRARGTLEHPVRVDDAAFDAAGQRLATTAPDGAVRIWDVATASLTASCETRSAVHGVRFAGDAVVATAGDGGVRVCSLAGELRQAMSGHLGGARALDISPDGRLAVTGSVDGTARVWNLAAGKALTVLAGHRGSVRVVQFSPDGRRVATGGDDTTIRIWDAESGAQLASLQGHVSRVDALRWDSEARIISASYDGTLRLWNAHGDSLDTSAPGHEGASDDLSQSPDGRHVITVGGRDGVAIVRDAASGQQRLVLRGERPISTASFAGSGHVITTTGDGTARLRRLADGALQAAIATGDAALTNAVAADDGTLLVTAAARDGRGVVRLWRTAPRDDGAVVPAGAIETDFEPLQLVFDPAQRWLVVAPLPDHRREFAVVVIDLATGREAARLPVGKNVFRVTVDRTRIAIAYDRVVRTFELATWRPLATLRGHRGIVQHVELLPDGRVVTASDDAAVHVWDGLGNLLAPLPSRGRPSALAVSAGGQFLAVGRGPVVEVWDAQAMRLLVATRLHREAVIAMQFSADGSRLASTAFDGRVGITRIAHPPRSAEQVERTVRCYVPLRLEGDTAVPREVDHDDPACARQPLR